MTHIIFFLFSFFLFIFFSFLFIFIYLFIFYLFIFFIFYFLFRIEEDRVRIISYMEKPVIATFFRPFLIQKELQGYSQYFFIIKIYMLILIIV